MPDRIASQSSYWSSAIVALIGFVTATGWPVIVGMLVAVGTAVVNWHYKRQAHLLDHRRTRAIEYQVGMRDERRKIVVVDTGPDQDG